MNNTLSLESSSKIRILTIIFTLASSPAIFIGVLLDWKKGFATLAYALLLAGIFFRKKKEIHAPLMILGIGLDLFLVIFLSVFRNAISVAANEPLNLIQYGHVSASTFAVILYFPVFYLGMIRYGGNASTEQKRQHRNFGLLAIIFRTVGYVLMFSM